MDIEKMIERLKWWAEECDRTNRGCQARKTLQDAADTLSTLQAENEKLRAELEQVQRERDAAVDFLKGQCRYCRKYLTCPTRRGPHDNCWQWRGPEEE